jgi:hypothetical protein
MIWNCWQHCQALRSIIERLIRQVSVQSVGMILHCFVHSSTRNKGTVKSGTLEHLLSKSHVSLMPKPRINKTLHRVRDTFDMQIGQASVDVISATLDSQCNNECVVICICHYQRVAGNGDIVVIGHVPELFVSNIHFDVLHFVYGLPTCRFPKCLLNKNVYTLSRYGLHGRSSISRRSKKHFCLL